MSQGSEAEESGPKPSPQAHSGESKGVSEGLPFPGPVDLQASLTPHSSDHPCPLCISPILDAPLPVSSGGLCVLATGVELSVSHVAFGFRLGTHFGGVRETLKGRRGDTVGTGVWKDAGRGHSVGKGGAAR